MEAQSKVAVVTGAALGSKTGGPSIGGAIAIRLAKDGFKVVVVDISEMGQKTVERITKDGDKAIFVRTDVRNTLEVKRALAITEEKFGGLNCLVNCAAYPLTMFKNLVELEEEVWLAVLDVNLNGYFRFAKYSVPLILQSGGGTIINISSVASFASIPNFGVYSVSKAAVDGLTRSLAVDFAPKVRVNSVCPSFVRVENSQGNRAPEELKRWYAELAAKNPLQRVAEVEDIANVVSFLASEQSAYINGQSIIVDGGKRVAASHKF